MSAEYNCPPVCPKCRRCHRGECDTMTMNNDTPRTDRLISAIEDREGEPVDGFTAPPEWVELARELERENTRLREMAARMAAEMREVDHEFCTLRDFDEMTRAANNPMETIPAKPHTGTATRNPPRWTPVSERLPSYEDAVDGNIWWATPDCPECAQEDGWAHPENSTHWMTPIEGVCPRSIALPNLREALKELVAQCRAGGDESCPWWRAAVDNAEQVLTAQGDALRVRTREHA